MKNLLLGLKEIIIMKNTNAYSYKLAVAATSLVMVYFVAGIASIAQSAELLNSELLKAEPVKQASLLTQAQADLALSFTTITVKQNSAQDNAESMIANQKVMANQNQPIILTKATFFSE